MAGPSETLGSPWPPLTIRLCFLLLAKKVRTVKNIKRYPLSLTLCKFFILDKYPVSNMRDLGYLSKVANNEYDTHSLAELEDYSGA
jgi:hypothetical protein